MTAFWHEAIGPQFESTTSVFSVNLGSEFSKNPSRIPVSSLSRLMHRPSHKVNRSKFDPTSENAQKHRENPVLTQEDSRGTEDALWVHSLRPLIPQKKIGERDEKRGNESADEEQEVDNKDA